MTLVNLGLFSVMSRILTEEWSAVYGGIGGTKNKAISLTRVGRSQTMLDSLGSNRFYSHDSFLFNSMIQYRTQASIILYYDQGHTTLATIRGIWNLMHFAHFLISSKSIRGMGWIEFTISQPTNKYATLRFFLLILHQPPHCPRDGVPLPFRWQRPRPAARRLFLAGHGRNPRG